MPHARLRFLRWFLRRRMKELVHEGQPIDERRIAVEDLCRHLHVRRGVAVTHVVTGPVQGLWFVPPDPLEGRAILHFHGGAFALGSPGMEQSLASWLAVEAPCKVFVPGYRLAPEHMYPAAHEDALAAWRWMQEHGYTPATVAVTGTSSGGTLAASLLLRLRDLGEGRPAAAALFSPLLDLSLEPSPAEPVDDVGFERERALEMIRMYFGEGDLRDPAYSPAFAKLKDLPPVLVQVSSDEWARGGCEIFERRAGEASSSVTLDVWEQTFQGWHLAPSFLPEAAQALKRAALFLRSAWS